jgi:Mg2+/Co2+ transporter CorB
VFIAGGLIGLFGGNWGLAFAVLSIALALITISNVFTPPGWAFKQANRLTKPLWVLIGIAALMPPLGWIYFTAWMICGRTIRNAWIATDPDGYRWRVLGSILASHW